MSYNFPKQKKTTNKQNTNFLSSKNNKASKRANSQKKYLNSPDIITQLSNPNFNSNNLYSNNNINLNLNLNLIHQQALTPINRRNKLYDEELLLPQKSSKFEGKKTLVLDIDETLVHSSFFPFEKNDLILNVNFDGIFYNIYVLVRPGAEQFIKNISKFFEIITFTASIPAYASPLLDILDKERNIQHRLYREHCSFINGVFIKDLKRLNRNLKDVIIVDNSPLAFAFDTENGLPILSWFDDPVDKELINIQPLLEFLANTNDVRKYIKKFVKNNNINYELAHKIIKENKEAKKIKNKIDKNNNKNENSENTNNIFIVAKDINKDNINEKDEEKNSINNSINDSKKKTKLLNNFINKNDSSQKKTNNINIFDKLNNLNNEGSPSNLKLEFSNIPPNNNKKPETNKKKLRNNKSGKNSVKNLNKKNNIFRLGLKINDNNIKSINNNFNPPLKFNNKIDINIENDYKLNNNILMPMIFSSPANTSKNKNYHLKYNNIKINKEKITNKPNEYFLKNKNAPHINLNNIQSLSLKETLEDKYKSVKQFKYINLIEKFQDNKIKSSSLKIISKNKDDLNLKNDNNNNINNGDNTYRNNKYKLKNKNNNLNIKNPLRISSKPKISSIINKGFAFNNAVNRNKMNDLNSQDIRSKSTGNFVKLKSAHIKTPKTGMNNNQFLNYNMKWFNEEENKMLFNDNINNNNKIDLLPINGYTPKNLKIKNN